LREEIRKLKAELSRAKKNSPKIKCLFCGQSSEDYEKACMDIIAYDRENPSKR
jgi:hypothetical protein